MVTMNPAVLDINVLEKELQQIRAQKQEVSERLRIRQVSQGGRGGRGGFGRGGGGRHPPRLVERISTNESLEIGNAQFQKIPSWNQSEQMDFQMQGGQSEPLPRLSSKVVEAKQEDGIKERSQSSLVSSVPSELGKRLRRSDSTDNPASLKRNKRMFGALLGTLERFKKEAKAEESVLRARQLAVQRAEERALQQSKELRDAERQKKRDQRRREIDRIRTLKLNAQKKELEIAYARKLKRQEELLKFIKTQTKPHVYWLPGNHSEDTKAKLLQQQCGFEGWKRQQMEELESEKGGLTKAALARWEIQDDPNNANNNHLLNTKSAAGDEDEEDQEQRPVEKRRRNIASRVVVVQQENQKENENAESAEQDENPGLVAKQENIENVQQQDQPRRVEIATTNTRHVEVVQQDNIKQESEHEYK
eukprot:TRINITY_DN17407_c1_g1_i1.p2 TRINITY_DN17407_c1_g1~~TRINITY_DN17407_c1_g1_i1.p2  ORF type:complete len:420 (-),score=97.52 TRINITY_DN17407_c1_g1_i1:355-1614(-)